ncbi:MAG: hypothetical protein AAF546_05800, partial [Verrucomicrobiota bacterium]
SMTAKLFSQCYIGESHREMCCCEALLLGYTSEDFGYLSNQVSIWLEGDLPTYHWFNRVPPERIRKYYDSLLVGVRRTIFDSSVEPEAVLDLDWPYPEKVADLARARLLTVRQALGQYLSGYTSATLSKGLQSVKVTHSDLMIGEGKHLLAWLKSCLMECGSEASIELDDLIFRLHAFGTDESDERQLAIEFLYEDGRYFRWSKKKNNTICEIESHLGEAKENLPTRIKPLTPDQTLSEALFF